MTKLKWHTEARRVKDLLPLKTNPRKISEKEFRDLKQSFKKFDLVEIPAVDVDGKIVAGHQRIAVLQLLERGDEMIDCRVPNRKLTQEEYNQYLITSNKVHGDWDIELLRDNFELDTLLESGFSNDELTDLFTPILDTEDDEFNVAKELEAIGKAKSKVGDLYQLGPHRLLCGDSTKLEVVQGVVGEVKIDMIYNDPIYNINLSYKSGIGGTKNYGGSSKDNRSENEYESFLKKTVENGLAVSNKDTHVFYYCDETYVPLIAKIYKDLGLNFKRICIWLKGIANPTPQVAFSKVYEPCVYGVRGKPYLSPHHKNYDEVMNKDIGTGIEMLENFYSMFDIWAEMRLAGNKYEHPTEKPITLHDKPIRRCTKVGDNILSLFGGSGGELIASDQLKRNCFVVELDPIFVDLIIRRYEKYSGNKAIRIN